MNRSTTTMAGIALAVAIAYPASSWFLGKKIEEISNQQLQDQLAAAPYIKLVRNEYDRRLFDATQTVTLELPAGMFSIPRLPAKSAKEAPETDEVETSVEATEQDAAAVESAPTEATAAPQPIQITIITDIKHGPFPGFKALGAASAESRVSFDAETQKTVDAAFSGKPALTASTLFTLSGGGHSVARMPAFRHSQAKEDGTGEYVFSGEAMEWQVDFTRGLKSYTLTGKAPRFELIDDARMVLNGFEMSGAQQRLFDDDPLLYTGKQNFKLASIEFSARGEEAATVQLKNLAYEFDIPSAGAQGEFIDMIAKMGTEELKIGEQNYGPAHYDFSFRHLNARRFSALLRSFTPEFYAQLSSVGEDMPPAEVFKPILGALQELTLDNAEFALDQFSFNTPQGEAKASAKVKLNQAVKQDWANPLLLIGKLELTADMALPESLLTAIPLGEAEDENVARIKKQRTERTLAMFVEQGYLTREIGILSGKLEFRNGKLLLSGKPFNPLGLALGKMPK